MTVQSLSFKTLTKETEMSENLIFIPAFHTVDLLHDLIVKKNFSAAGTRDASPIFVAFRQTEIFIQNAENVTVPDVAAVLALSIVRAEGYIDGNNQAAYAAMNLTLSMNGMQLNADKETVVQAIVKASKTGGDRTELAEFLEQHCIEDPVYQALFEHQERLLSAADMLFE